MKALLLAYLQKSDPITLGVLGLLSFYFLLVNWIFFYRFLVLGSWIVKEKFSLESFEMGSKKPSMNSFLSECPKLNLDLCVTKATTKATSGLTFLSIAASTSPFIGLFGTVISILQTFYILGSTKASLATIASSIGEALVATAAGIFVAVFAYSYHLVLKRRAFHFVSLVKMQIDILEK